MGKTDVLPTHYLEEAYQLPRRVIVIDRGVVIADAPPAEIKSKVAGKKVRFVAPDLHEKNLEGLPVTAVTIKDGRVQLLSNQPESVLPYLFRLGMESSDLDGAVAALEC